MKVKLWLPMWFAALGACASVATGSQGAPRDAPAVVDAPPVIDAPEARDAPAPRDTPPDLALHLTRVAFSLYGGIAPGDGPEVSVTFLDDGRAFRVASRSAVYLRPEDQEGRLAGGAAEVTRLRREMESDGLLDVPEASYPPIVTQWTGPWTLVYVRDGRARSWTTLGPEGTDPTLWSAIEAVIRASRSLE